MSRINVANFRHPDGTSDNISLTDTGRVGIGTTSAKRLLHLNGGSETVKLQITNTATGSSTDGDGFQIGIATAGTAYIEQRENADLILTTNNTERVRILAAGGLTFNGDTAAANALDDYEEGSWDPTITATTGTITVNSTYNTLSYTKIGRMVHIYGHIRIGSISGWGPGNIDINGLPYTVATAIEDGRGSCSVVLYDSSASTAYKISVMPFYFIESSTKIQLAADRWNGGYTPGAGDEFHISGSYVAA